MANSPFLRKGGTSCYAHEWGKGWLMAHPQNRNIASMDKPVGQDTPSAYGCHPSKRGELAD